MSPQSPQDRALFSSPAWICALAITVVLLFVPRPELTWLRIALSVAQASSSFFVIVYAITIARRYPRNRK